MQATVLGHHKTFLTKFVLLQAYNVPGDEVMSARPPDTRSLAPVPPGKDLYFPSLTHRSPLLLLQYPHRNIRYADFKLEVGPILVLSSL